MYFMPEKMSILKIKFLCFLRLFYILLLVFYYFLELNRWFTLKMDLDVYDFIALLVLLVPIIHKF